MSIISEPLKFIILVTKSQFKGNRIQNCFPEPVKQDLLDYYAWLQENDIQSEWLFPSTTHQDRCLSGLRNPLSQ